MSCTKWGDLSSKARNVHIRNEIASNQNDFTDGAEIMLYTLQYIIVFGVPSWLTLERVIGDVWPVVDFTLWFKTVLL